MTRLLSLIGLGLVSLMGGCSEPREHAKARLHGVDAKALRTDAARIYKQLYSSPGTDYVPLKPAAWPESFKKLKPLRIGVYPNGFALAIDGATDSEEGIHIVPLGMTTIPASTHARYERLEDGVYWFVHRKDGPGN